MSEHINGDAQSKQTTEQQGTHSKHVIDRAPSALFACSAEKGRPLLYASERLGHLTGRPIHELLAGNCHLDRFIARDDLVRVRDAISRALNAGNDYQVSYRLINEQLNKANWVIESGAGYTGANDEPTIHGMVAPFHSRADHRDLIEHHARFDSSTGLPNRRSLKERVQSRISQMRRANQPFAIHFVDIDRFEEVNETYGESRGDEVLNQVALRLLCLCGEGDLVARIGGDEFAIVQDHVASSEEAGTFAERVCDSLCLPFDVAEREIHITVSIGICTVESAEFDAEEALGRAHFAMHHAKRDGRNRYRFHDDKIHEQVRRQMLRARALPAAMQRNELLVHYQPQIHLQTGKTSGFEALVRWQHPEEGLLGPDGFIGVAEKSGLIGELGEWVLRTACRETRDLILRHPPHVRLAVNVSAYQLSDHFFAGRLLGILEELDFPLDRMEIELTESVLISATTTSRDTIHHLADKGVRFSADDFGTGYSSLQYLKHLPVSCLKIDQEFIRDLPNRVDTAIVKSSVDLAHSLDMDVVAEGVEEEHQSDTLRDIGCDNGQGYLFSRPVPIETIATNFGAPG